MFRKLFLGSFIITLLASCGGQGASEAQIGEYTTIEVKEVYDLGTVAKGASVEANIEIKNTGDFPFIIANIQPACSCTVSEYDENPIPPGATTVVKAVIDTDKTGGGMVNKAVNIMGNTRPPTTQVMLKVRVQ